MKDCRFPLSTGDVARLLSTPEHRVVNPIRQGKLDVPNIGGRRIWDAKNVLRLARLLGKDSPEVRNLCKAGGAE